MDTKPELHLHALHSVRISCTFACKILLHPFSCAIRTLPPSTLNRCLLNELYVMFIANSIGVANATVGPTLLSMCPWHCGAPPA